MYNKRVLSKIDLGKYKKPNPYSKDIITDPMGQWKYPGVPTRIPSNDITMQGVGYPVLGVANTGQTQMMMPGADYTFPGANYVDEYPQMQDGGTVPVIEDAGSFNAEGYWIPDWETMKKQAKELNAKTVKTKNGAMIYFDDNWNVQSVDDNPQMKKGGVPKSLVKMPKPSKKGLASKKFTSSVMGTSRLFTESPLFAKPKKKKNRIFDPNAKYYQEGGENAPWNPEYETPTTYEFQALTPEEIAARDAENLMKEQESWTDEQWTAYKKAQEAEAYQKALVNEPKYFDESMQFVRDWHDSPMYNQMVLNSYQGNKKNADYLTKLRKENIESIPELKVKTNQEDAGGGKLSASNTAAWSMSDTGQVEVFPAGFEYGPSLYVHENFHSSDRPRELYKWNHPSYKDEEGNFQYPNWMVYNDPKFPNEDVVWHDRVMPTSDQRYISGHRSANWKDNEAYKISRAEDPEYYKIRSDEEIRKQLEEDGISKDDPDYNMYYNNLKEYDRQNQERINKYEKEYWKDFGHGYVSDPTEVRARLGEIRYHAKKEGVYDPFTEQITPEIFQQYINTDRDKENWQPMKPIDELRQEFTDEEILWMLQNISKNEEPNKEIDKAKKGGEPGDKFKKRLMKRNPGMQGVYGPEGENLNIVRDPNYDAGSKPYYAGDIEFMFPGLPDVSYKNKDDETLPDYVYKNPSPDKYTSVYNPRGANRADIFLDMLHGMRDDQNYEVLLQNFDKAVRDARGGDMQYYYEQDVANNNYTDGQEQWNDNYVDGQLRAQLAPGTLGMFSHGRKDYRKERKHDSPEMKQAAKDIRNYIKGKYTVGGAASPKDLDPVHMKKYLEALRYQENDAKKGYKNGKWYPHHSVEGGADTIAYGHKLTPNDAYLRKGITEEQAISLQEQDVLKNQALAKKQVDKKYGAGTFDSLPQDSQMLLVDYQYNLGTLSGFPSFVKATVEGNKEKMLAEHKRYGAGIPLTRRNEWTAGVINNMQTSEPFDPMQVAIPAANVPDATNVVQPVIFNGPSEVELPPNAKGGFIELDLDDADIAQYVNGGFIVEDISVPSLNQYPNGGEPKRKKTKFVPGTYDPAETAGYILDEQEVVVSGKASNWGKAAIAYEKRNPEQEFVDKKKKEYLKRNKGLNKLYGLSMDNFPEDVEQNFRDEYDYRKNSAVVKKVGKQEGWNPNKRTEYVDELNDTQRGIVAESKYGSKLQPSTWNRALAGVQELGNTLLPGQPFKYNIPGLTKKEQKEMRDSKLSALEIMAPMNTLGQNIANYTKNVGLSTGSDYKELPGVLSGEFMPNVTDVDAMALDPIQLPLMLSGAAELPLLIGKGGKAAIKLMNTEDGLLSKVAKGYKEVPKELPGSPNASLKSSLKNLDKSFVGSMKVVDETLGELLQGSKNRESIAEGNAWLQNWIEHPTTQQKINISLDIADAKTRSLLDKSEIPLIREQASKFTPLSSEYPLSNQIKENLLQYAGKNKRGNVHADNWGVSYMHGQNRGARERILGNRAFNPNKTIESPYEGSWISRTLTMPQEKRVGTTIHEGTHDWVDYRALEVSGQKDASLAVTDPEIRDDYFEWTKLRNEGKSSREIDKIMGRKRADQAYFANPTEMHARIMELRKHFNLTPDEYISPERAQQMINELESMKQYKAPVRVKPFLNVVNKDPNKLAFLFNKFWAVPPAAIIGSGMLPEDQNVLPSQKNGGIIMELSDKEISEYQKGGWIVEEL